MINRSASFDPEGQDIKTRPESTRPIRVTDDDVREFKSAMDNYKERSGRLFPTCCELLEVLREIGYAKRIWRPVGVWVPIESGAPGIECQLEGSAEVSGWYANVETQST